MAKLCKHSYKQAWHGWECVKCGKDSRGKLVKPPNIEFNRAAQSLLSLVEKSDKAGILNWEKKAAKGEIMRII